MLEKLNGIQADKCEIQVLEIKVAEQGCPKKLYNTLSGFSNLDDSGTIVFGVDEKNNYNECGVYNPQDIQKIINEALLNTLVHRDYSIHTEGMPIQILMYPDRIAIRNPGGIYGRLRVDQLGKMQPDTRNPVLVTALEVMGLTENRYSGIPTIRRSMKEFNLEAPVFSDERGTFTVILYKRENARDNTSFREMTDKEEELLNFLKLPRSRNEIAEHLGIGTISYVMQTYINPLIEKGLVRLTIPEKPKSPKQRFVRK